MSALLGSHGSWPLRSLVATPKIRCQEMAACDFKGDESEARMAKKKSLDDAFAAAVANALSGVMGEARSVLW